MLFLLRCLSVIHCIQTAHSVECFYVVLIYRTAICKLYVRQLGKHSESVLDNCQYQSGGGVIDLKLLRIFIHQANMVDNKQ